MGNTEATLAAEREEAKRAREDGLMPIPTGKNLRRWRYIKDHYKLPDFEKIDSVLCKPVLPENWKIVEDTDTPSGITSLIIDHDNGTVGRMHYTNPGHNSKGFTHIYTDRLREIGVMKNDCV